MKLTFCNAQYWYAILGALDVENDAEWPTGLYVVGSQSWLWCLNGTNMDTSCTLSSSKLKSAVTGYWLFERDSLPPGLCSKVATSHNVMKRRIAVWTRRRKQSPSR